MLHTIFKAKYQQLNMVVTNGHWVSKPLGFFVLALLIVESFLSIVLVYSNMTEANRLLGMLIGVILFVVVVVIVAILVWCKPTHLMYGEKAHLEHEKNFGSQDKPVTQSELRKMKNRESNGKHD